MVTHQLQVRCRPVKVRRSETDVLSLSHPTNRYDDDDDDDYILETTYTTTVVTVAYEYLKFQNLTIAIHREVTTDQTKTSARDVTTMTWAAEHSRCDVADDRLIAGHKRRPLGAEKM